MPVARRSRSYESPLRAEQADRTREKLVDTAIDIIKEDGGDDLNVRLLAKRAGVSVPTAYRYFADRDALLDAIGAKIRARFAGTTIPTTTDDLSAWARHIYANYETHDRLVRAQLNTPIGRLLRAKNQKARDPKLLEMMKSSLPATTATAQRRITALINLLVHAPAWVSLHDQWQMTGAEAGAAATWAIETLLAATRKHPSALDFDIGSAASTDAPSSTPRRARAGRARKNRG